MTKNNPFTPVGLHVDTLYEIRKALRALRRAERRIQSTINREKRHAKPTST